MKNPTKLLPLLGLVALASSALAEEPDGAASRVLVRLAPPSGGGEAASEDGSRTPLALSQDAVLSALPEGSFREVRRFRSAPVLSLSVTPEALLSLRRQPGVLAVVEDGIVRPAGQVGAAQIGADRLLSLGVAGRGRTVAVVDSGVDALHPDLGGAIGERPKVLAGFNFADGNDDLRDCSGHGTAVAGVVAGPQGVAPDADVVALKVFGSRDGCTAARFSDVLAAVDWAVAERRRYQIDAINLSLADDKAYAGFCDSQDPASAAVFSAARQAGLAVLAAAGNDGRPDSISWPACLSDVAAVGMVYSQAQGSVAWGSTCTDRRSGADLVPCASNSGTALSFLAPGVNWLTAASGGGRQTFSGTSAATPAAAGAVILTRQARVLSDPALALDLLRATGLPVLDDKSERVSPRLDVGAALDATSPFTGPCSVISGGPVSGAVGIPDGLSSGVSCEVEVSALVGDVSSLVVALTIDHPDPTQLVATLTGPDGTDVLLMNRSGRKGQAVREVFGRTAEPIEPLSSFSGRPASGRWRLNVMDTVPGGGSGRLVSWALSIEPTVPPVGGPIVRSAVFPTVAHVPGRYGSFFTTDVHLFNTDSKVAREVSLRFVPAGQDGLTTGQSVSITIPPLGNRILRDLVGNVFRATDFGPLHLNLPPGVVAGSRTQSSASLGGAYGSFVRPAQPAVAVGRNQRPFILVPSFRTEGFRVNVGVTEVLGSEALVQVSLKDRQGAPKGYLERLVAPLSVTQVNDVYSAIGAVQDEGDRIEVSVAGGAGRVLAYASAVDNATNDGTFVSGSVPMNDLLLPAVSRSPGRFGANFKTDLKLANPSISPMKVKITYFPTTGPAFDPVVVALPGGGTRLFVDVLGELFRPDQDASGALRLTGLDGATMVASSRTYTEGESGSYGLAIDPVQGASEATPGHRLALLFLAGGTDVRTNVGFLETSGLATTARLSLYTRDGSLLVERELSFEAGTAVQWNDVFAQLGIPPRENVSGILEVLTGGSLAVHSIQINNVTNDAGFFPAVLLP